MTTTTAKPLSAGRYLVPDAAPRTRRPAQPGLPAGQAPQASTPPSDLLGRVRGYLGYVGRLLDARTTLAEYRRLLVVGG